MLGRLETSDQAGSGVWGAFKLWAEPASGRDAKKVRKGAFSPSCFPSSGSVRLGLQPWLSPPLLPPVRAYAQLALALSCLSNRLSPVPVLSQPPYSHACPGGCGASLGRAQGPLPSFSLQQHACHQVTGLMPEPCQSLQPCPCPGTSGIQELGLGAILHLYSGLRARQLSQYPGHSCHVPGWEWHCPLSCQGCQQRPLGPLSQSLPAGCSQARSTPGAAMS